MSITKTLGGDRLGSGNKMKVHMHNYERSTHDLSYLWRSTMAPGTLVPFICEVALPGDTFDIKLDADCKTHPTIGPLFGSYKLQLDVFLCPIRLYQAELHNNKLGIGNDMRTIRIPQMTLPAKVVVAGTDLDNQQISNNCLLNYLGIRGVGYCTVTGQSRQFNAIPLLAYWDIFKNYYSNKQENNAYVIHATNTSIPTNVSAINAYGLGGGQANPTLLPKSTGGGANINIGIGTYFYLTVTSGQTPDPNGIFVFSGSRKWSLAQFCTGWGAVDATTWRFDYDVDRWGAVTINRWWTITGSDVSANRQPTLQSFLLGKIDEMREWLLINNVHNTTLDIVTANLEPYKYLFEQGTDFNSMQFGQEGLAVKTYQSDLFNNWLNKAVYDIQNARSNVSTASGSFSIDSLNLAKKVYDLLNRIQVSGGTYQDWIEAAYGHERIWRTETPVYQGGLSKEIIFQEVISNSAATTPDGAQPLGQLAGRGILGQKHKGGYIHISVDEPSYVIALSSITPRIDYSQGNKWDTHLLTMDDFHKPGLDQIGFQDLTLENLAWWGMEYVVADTAWKTYAAGKQPAWIHYMTNVNKTYGNFATADNQMFMTLNRRYERGSFGAPIKDLTTYIDPAKYNYIFAQPSIDANNFWMQIAVNMEVRRKMSAKIMPNL